MIKRKIFSIIILFVFGNLFAQTFVGKLNYNPSENNNIYSSTDTLKILAVISDFVQDKDDATFGDGKFGSVYSKDYGVDILDPLPHNKAYFENHLKFVKNYFEKVSNGKLNISYKILDDILTVSKTMREYSPPVDDVNNLNSLGNYLEEVWQLADSRFPSVDFSQYDLFFVFHAGVGKDVSLPGSLGNERDLPSVYLNEKSLKNIFGNTFDGFPVNNGNFKITNSAILPETESRELDGLNGKTLIELTTNGLLAATVGSYLGLPDLYNTETGRSAIGRFGLMDGQSMFAYQGIFPPEPSAWEKMRLGWITPVKASVDKAGKITVVNKYSATSLDTTLLLIPINSTEYYLVENRKRDANKDGSTVTFVSKGETHTITFDKDYGNYIFYNVDTLKGVITDVDEFDWALPSGTRKSNIDKFEDVGLIIWHIDEQIINSNYQTNTINNDRYKRGVAVVEADGVRDIGEEFKTIFGETIIGEGSKEDTWYKNNPADYYKNKFSFDTKPKASTNSGANSLITISEFSDIANRMSFNLSFGSENITPLGISAISNFLWLSAIDNGNNSRLFSFSGEKVFEISASGNVIKEIDTKYYAYKPAVVKNGNGINIVLTSPYLIGLVQIDNAGNIDTVYAEFSTRVISTSPVLNSVSGDFIKVNVGTFDGKILTYSINTGTVKSITQSGIIDVFNNETVLGLAGNAEYLSAYSQGHYWNNKISVPLELDTTPEQILVSRNTDNEVKSVLYSTNGIFVADKSVMSIVDFGNFRLDKNNKTDRATVADKIILADIKKNGKNYIIINDDALLTPYNLNGYVASNFPVFDEYKTELYGAPLAVDLTGDEAADIITFTVDGKILAFDGVTGKIISGFPISCGGKISGNPIVFTANGKTAFAVATRNNLLLTWNISKKNGIKFWTEFNGNAGNTASVKTVSTENQITEFFPHSKAYNWPNPVYENVTKIRYYVSENSKVKVTIFDIAGDLVAKLSGNAVGGYNNEIEWDVSNIESGVYFAHLEVTGTSGKSDSKIIKIAIIK
jgi:M6 family metalloprotease-like protein